MLGVVEQVAGAVRQVGKAFNRVADWLEQRRRDELVAAEDDRDELLEERERVQAAKRARWESSAGSDGLRSDDGYRRD